MSIHKQRHTWYKEGRGTRIILHKVSLRYNLFTFSVENRLKQGDCERPPDSHSLFWKTNIFGSNSLL